MSLQGIIVFVGTVGSGKSTHMNLLASKLKKNNYKVVATTIKSGHLFAFLLELTLVKLLSLQIKKNTCIIRTMVEKRPLLFKKLFNLFLILDVVSILCRFFVTVYLPKKLGYVILVEEYFQGAIADHIHLAEFVGIKSNRCLLIVTKILLMLIHLGGPVHTLFLDSSDGVLRNRWCRRASNSQRSDYLCMQRTLLFSISKQVSLTFSYINTETKTIENTADCYCEFFKTAF